MRTFLTHCVVGRQHRSGANVYAYVHSCCYPYYTNDGSHTNGLGVIDRTGITRNPLVSDLLHNYVHSIRIPRICLLRVCRGRFFGAHGQVGVRSSVLSQGSAFVHFCSAFIHFSRQLMTVESLQFSDDFRPPRVVQVLVGLNSWNPN